ncbi:MAG: carboxypeptidase-like regulatory domain-containing protein, partial [Candidatus Sulfotelmatobacter sp.]
MKRRISSCTLQGFLTLAVCVILGVSTLHAQVDTGSITGTVTDASGAVVSGAKVTLINEGTGTTLTTNSGADGVYDFSPVRIGSYKLETSAQGFKTESHLHITVDVSARVLLNFQLQPGSVSETVEVNTTPPALQAEDASVGQVVGEREVNNLPLNGRNFTFLAQLAAGVNTPQADTRGNAG